MGKKGGEEVVYFAPSKALLKQRQENAARAGVNNTTYYNNIPTQKQTNTDWNAVKLNSAKWSRATETQNKYLHCPSLSQICIRFIAAHAQIYVQRETNANANASARKPASASTHARHVAESYFVVDHSIAQDHAEVKTYRGNTYAHLAGSLMYLPEDLRDEVLLCALRDATLRYSQIPAFLHPFLRQLDLSRYGKEFSHAFVDYLLPKLDKIDTGEGDDWEQIDEWSIHQAYRGCPNLTHLDLSNCVIYPHKLQEILNACPVRNLKLMHYPLKKTITTPPSIPLSSKILEGLDISFCNIPFEFDFPALVHLDISYNHSGSPISILSIANNSKRLKFLNISGMSLITISPTQLLFSSLSCLKYLVAKDNTIDPTLLFNPPTAMKQLTTLNLSGNTHVDEHTVLHIAASYEMLRALDLTHVPFRNPSSVLADTLAVRPLLEIDFGKKVSECL